jgi:microcin C transport system substrate-binding protein
MRYILNQFLIFLFTLSIFFPQIANAQEKSYGMAMNGAPKHSHPTGHYSFVNPDAPKGGHLKQAATGTFDTLNPFSIKGNAAKELDLVYDRLMARNWNEPFTLYPLIASSIDVSEDNRRMVVHINPLARFNDDTSITADDVLFSFETLKEKGRPNMRQVYRQVESISKLDNSSIEIILGDTANRETPMIIAMMPVLSKTWWADRDFEATLLDSPNSSGPYLIESVDVGRSITYIRNPDYWAADLLPRAGMYNFDRITYDYFRDDNVALEALLKGNLNFRREWDNRKWNSLYRSGNVKKLEFKHGRPQQVRAMIFNMRRPPFDDLNVRKALYLAFDGEWIGKNIFQDKLTRINSYFPNSQLSAELPLPTKGMSPRDRLKEAKDLLSKSGWSVIDNKLQKEGKPLTFEILLTQAEDEKIALSFINSLKRLGVQANVRTLDTASFQRRLLDYDYDMIFHHWQNSLSPGTEQVVYWSCEAANQPGRFNYAGICREDLDELVNEIANAETYEDLTAMAKQIDTILLEEYISIPLFYNGADLIAIQKNLFEYPTQTPLYGPVIESWWMPEINGNAE